MESWSNEFFEMLDTVAVEIEQFLTDVAKDVTVMVDGLMEVSEAIAEQMQTGFVIEMDQYITTLVDPILEAYLGFEVTLEETTQPMMHTIDPILNNHPVCVGCRHYHGQSYGGTLLVCGMHPYGWQEEKCPDWESTWQ